MAEAAESFGKSKNGQTTGKRMFKVARRGEVGEKTFRCCTLYLRGGWWLDGNVPKKKGQYRDSGSNLQLLERVPLL